MPDAPPPPHDRVDPRGWLRVHAWGVRRGFRWTAPYLRPLRLHYWLAYWNPTPGAAVTVDGTCHDLGPGTLLLVPAGCWLQRASPAPVDHWWCHLASPGRPARPGAVACPVAGALGEALERSWAAAWREGCHHPGSLAWTHAALALGLTGVAWQGEAAAPADPRLARLVQELETAGWPALGNEALAARLDMHAKAFCRRFHQILGEAPQTWLRARRLDLAAERLGQGMAVEEAAALGGFADRFHFSRLFRRHCGLGPGLYRRLAATGTA